MNKACLEPIFDARRRLLIFGFHWWNCNAMYVKECFRTRVEKLAETLYSTRDIWSYKTSKEPKILQVVGVRFSKILWFFSTLLIKLFEKIKLAFRIVQKSILFLSWEDILCSFKWDSILYCWKQLKRYKSKHIFSMTCFE